MSPPARLGSVRYERTHIAAMSGYSAGEQPADPGIIKLNTNENPYPPSPAVARALRDFDAEKLRRYPESGCSALCQSIAERLGLDASRVMATNGGDEFLRLVFTTFCEPGSSVLSTAPTYSLYPVLAELHACRWKDMPLAPEFGLPPDLAEEANRLRASLLLVVNPHAPTGCLFSIDALHELASRTPGVLLVDEAYVDFVDPATGHDSLTLIREHSNVLLLRTFSKGYSLAGLRLGFGLGAESLIEPMADKVRDSYNLDALAQHLGLAAWQDPAYQRQTAEAVRRERARLTRGLRELGFALPDSHTNFVYARPPDGVRAAALYQFLKERGILVRHFPDSDNRLRISVGSERENRALLDACAHMPSSAQVPPEMNRCGQRSPGA